jgi:hypothetical protein
MFDLREGFERKDLSRIYLSASALVSYNDLTIHKTA